MPAAGEEAAATAMQAAARGSSQRRENEKNAQAAIGLQAAARGGADRRKVDRIRNPTAEELELQREAEEFAAEQRARKSRSQEVSKVQALTRGFGSRKEVAQIRATAEVKGVIKIGTSDGIARVQISPRIVPRRRGNSSSICFVPSRTNGRQYSR